VTTSRTVEKGIATIKRAADWQIPGFCQLLQWAHYESRRFC